MALELDMCYVNISLITDYDVGIDGIPPVSHHEVMEVFKKNNDRVKNAIGTIIAKIDLSADCSCHHALAGARG